MPQTRHSAKYGAFRPPDISGKAMRRTLMKGDAMTSPLYVIGDIHGEIAMLDTALDRIAADGGAGAPMISLGDLVDRGSGSRALI